MSRASERRQARKERISTRQDARTERRQAKFAAKSVAYEHGIDPDAAKWGAIADMTESVGETVGSIYGKGSGGGGKDDSAMQKKSLEVGSAEELSAGASASKINPMIVIAIIIVAIIFVFKRK